jgi:hypothetical protein
MDALTKKKELLESIRLSEGVNFECDEAAILKEYAISSENKSSLAIKVLSIFGGFLATLAFLGFLAIAGLYDSEYGLLIFGIGFIVLAIWLNKEFNKLIIDTFSIATYVIGFCLLAFGLTQLHIDENSTTLIICSIALCSLFVTQNYMLSFISVVVINGCFLFLIISNDLYNLVHLYVTVTILALAYFFLNEAKIISISSKLSKLYNPVRIGLVISVLFGLVVIGKKGILPIAENYLWLSSIVMAVVMLYLVYTIIKILELTAYKHKLLIYSLSGLLFIITLFSPAISGAIIIILVSFLVNYKTGLVIGIGSFIYFISQYYYDLNFTLFTKSMMLFSSGIVFLLFYVFTSKMLKTNEKI